MIIIIYKDEFLNIATQKCILCNSGGGIMAECNKCINSTYCLGCTTIAKYLKEDNSGCTSTCTLLNKAAAQCVINFLSILNFRFMTALSMTTII